MSKGAVGLVAGYWPEDIYRYLAIPGLNLDEGVVTRPSRRRADGLALAQDHWTVAYRDLSEQVDRSANLYRAMLAGAGTRVALSVRNNLVLARLLLGAVRARCVALLLEPDLAPAAYARHLAAFQPDLVLADAPGTLPEQSSRVLTPHDFWQREAVPGKSTGRLDLKAPAVAMVGSGGGLVYHSHASLVAWAVSWSAFLALSEESVVLTLEPLSRWGGLLAALPALFRGGACAFVTTRNIAEVIGAVRRYRPAYLVLSPADAIALAAREHPSLRHTLRESVEGAFVVVESPFSVRERRHLETALGVPVLTLLGNPEVGPALASHPTWYLDEAVGIPVTNVDVWPLNPGTREALAVPWEAIEFGEVGVRSPMVAADYQTPEHHAAFVTDEWVRMGVVATMDPNGLFYLRQ